MPFEQKQLQETIENFVSSPIDGENWTIIMKICDYVSANETGPDVALCAIGKELRSNSLGKVWRAVKSALILLEALVNNCGITFHIYLVNEDFLRSLKGVISRKRSPPENIERQLLSMIQDWVEMFGDDPTFSNIRELYDICKEQGYEFPKSKSQESNYISQVSTKTPTQVRKSSIEKERPKTALKSISKQAAQTVLIKNLPDKDIAKLRHELDTVNFHVEVFEEIITGLETNREHDEDWRLLLDINQACQRMQARIVALLTIVAIEDVAVELLHCNDKINKVFRYFNIYLKNRELSNSQLAISEERRERGSESLIGQNVTEESKSNAEATTKTPTNEVDRGQSINSDGILIENSSSKSNLSSKNSQQPIYTSLPEQKNRTNQLLKIAQRPRTASIKQTVVFPNELPDVEGDQMEKADTNKTNKEENKNQRTEVRSSNQYTMRAKRLSATVDDDKGLGYKITNIHNLETK